MPDWFSSILKAHICRLTGTYQVPVVLLISAFENGNKPVWHGSEVASVNALQEQRPAWYFAYASETIEDNVVLYLHKLWYMEFVWELLS